MAAAFTGPEPPDFYLWGYLEGKVHGNNPQTIPDLKAAITAVIRAILMEECGSAIDKFARRVQVCSQCRRALLEHILGAPVKQSFCCTDLKLWECLLYRLDLMWLKFCAGPNKISEVIRLLAMTVFLRYHVPTYIMQCVPSL